MSATAAELVIAGGRCLLPGRGLVVSDVVCHGGRIVEIRPAGSSRGAAIAADGWLVLPGIVDIHGDAFERQIMPRPKTMFPLDLAMRESDRQLIANGITTAYHGITISWEPGLRSLENSLAVVAALDRLEGQLAADNRIHLRWETFALDALGEVEALLAHAKAPLLAFNDHTTHFLAAADLRSAIGQHSERSMVAPERYLALLEQVMTRRDAVPGAIRQLAAAAMRHGVRMLSHDDRTPGERRSYRGLGAGIAEFPKTSETLEEAVAAGDVVVLGAPNVVRGGSHTGAVAAGAAVARGQCSVLASDYYYPAPLAAALALAERGVVPFEAAWTLVSAGPAKAAGLADRGLIAEGLRADIVVVDPSAQRAVATVCGGRIVYRAG